MIKVPIQDLVDAQFLRTNFGPMAETQRGRIEIVAKCIIQRACGFAAGGTITAICRSLNMLTRNNTPRLWARRWAFQVTLGTLRHEADHKKDCAKSGDGVYTASTRTTEAAT